MFTTENKIKPSITAYSVAHAVRIARNMFNHIAPSDSVALLDYFLAYHQEKQTDLLLKSFVHYLELLPYACQNWLLSSLVATYYTTIIAMRKHYIEENVRRFIDSHEEKCQVVVFGGGYDTMPLRLSVEFPEVLFFESDRGVTRDIKMEALNNLLNSEGNPLKLYAEPRDNLKFLYIDVADDDFKDKLSGEGFDINKPTLFICEGLTMYLEKHEVKSLLEGIHSFNNPQNEVSIGFSCKKKDTSSLGLNIGSFFRHRTNEQYLLSFEAQQALDFLNETGFKANYRLSYGQLAELSGVYDNISVDSAVHQFVVSPVEVTENQQFDEIEHYPVSEPDYSPSNKLNL